MSKLWRWIPVLVLVIIIFILSDIPSLHLYDDQALSPFWRELIKRYTFRIGTKGFFSYTISPHPDFILHKLGHMAAYGALGTALFFAVGRAKLAVFLTMIYAVSDEIHQGFIGRSCRFWDIALDTVSAAAAIWLVKRYLQKREEYRGDGVRPD